MKNKKLLIFDAYGTLISTGDGSIKAAEKILLLSPDMTMNAAEFYSQWKNLHRRHIHESIESGFVTEQEIFARDLAELYVKYDICRSAEEDVKIMLTSLYGRKLSDETAAVISALRKTYRVVIGSTTDTEPLLENLDSTGLEVDAVYTSESLRAYKPAPEFYRSILKSENCTPEEAVFIGDSLTDDVLGPKLCGVTTVHIDRKSKSESGEEADYRFTDLDGLLTIL